MKKVLIITYYWPPSGGAGVQRWLKFSKYLPENGWIPVIYTPSNPEYPQEDNSLYKDIHPSTEVIKKRIWEPYMLYKFFTRKEVKEKVQHGFLSENKKPSFTEKIATWIRGNFFIPDARKYWIKPSVKYLLKYIKENPVDAIISTGPPHSMHLIAFGLQKQLNIPWLADFRDPWTQIDFYHHLMLTKWADNIHKKLEKQVLQNADIVTTVSNNCSGGLKKIHDRSIEVINNGFDEDDFKFDGSFDKNHFTLTHLGSLNPDRNPLNLWKALSELVAEDKAFNEKLRICLIGKTDYSIIEALNNHHLADKVQNHNYLPRDKALMVASKASVLLLPLNNTPNVMGITTGKLYEYLALKRPVLCIGPQNGDAAAIIRDCNAGKTAGFNEKEKIKSLIKEFFTRFQKDALYTSPGNISKFSRKELTSEISKLLDKALVR